MDLLLDFHIISRVKVKGLMEGNSAVVCKKGGKTILFKKIITCNTSHPNSRTAEQPPISQKNNNVPLIYHVVMN